MGDGISKVIDVAGDNPRIDAACKAILSNRPIMAHLLMGTLDEYAGRPIDEVAACIEGEPFVDGALVNADGGTLVRMRDTVDKTVSEGAVTFDLLFEAKLPGGDERGLHLIINVETQNDFHPGYALVTRGIYYCGRLLGGQGGQEVAGSNYGNLCKVCSVWICTNPPAHLRDTMDVFSIGGHRAVGPPGLCAEPKDFDKLTVVIVCLGPDRGDGRRDGVFGLLDALFDPAVGAEKKKRILREDFGIPVGEALERQVDDMCDMGQLYMDRGLALGRTEGLAEGRMEGRTEAQTDMVLKMLAKGALPVADIAEYAGVSADEVVRLKAELAPKAGK